MNSNDLDRFIKQHKDNYKIALIDIIKNNTDVLVDQDIASLLKKPPLDSMDLIKMKFIDLAKKNNIILNTSELSELLDNYREALLKCCIELKNIRNNELCSIVEKKELIKKNDIIKVNKKDFISINKEINAIIKNKIEDSFNKYILKDISIVFSSDNSDEINNSIINDITVYINGFYLKQLLENINNKMLVKDTILINSIAEHGDRYKFTLNNSRLLNSTKE